MRLENFAIMSAGDMSQATLTSDVAVVDSYYLACIVAVYTGAPVGALKLQASIDNTNWTDISGSSVSITTAGNSLYNIADVAYKYIRALYTKASGTGSLSIRVNAKGF